MEVRVKIRDVGRDKKDYDRNKIIRQFKMVEPRALSSARTRTPVDTGVTAESWTSSVKATAGTVELSLSNSSVAPNGQTIVSLLVNGHGTGTGGYVPPNDFVQPVMDEIERALDKVILEALDG